MKDIEETREAFAKFSIDIARYERIRFYVLYEWDKNGMAWELSRKDNHLPASTDIPYEFIQTPYARFFYAPVHRILFYKTCRPDRVLPPA
jgi:hypothetical protein